MPKTLVKNVSFDKKNSAGIDKIKRIHLSNEILQHPVQFEIFVNFYNKKTKLGPTYGRFPYIYFNNDSNISDKCGSGDSLTIFTHFSTCLPYCCNCLIDQNVQVCYRFHSYLHAFNPYLSAGAVATTRCESLFSLLLWIPCCLCVRATN